MYNSVYRIYILHIVYCRYNTCILYTIIQVSVYTFLNTIYTCKSVCTYIFIHQCTHTPAHLFSAISPWAWPLRSCTPACTRVCAHSSGPARLPSSTWGNVVFNPRPGGLKSQPHISFLATSRAGLPAAAQPLADWAEPPLAVSHTEQKLSPNTCSQNKFFFLFCTK